MEKKKILVIEDNLDIREGIAEILELTDEYEVFQAENGKVGIEIATTTLPDLILCDIMMPELDGYGVLYMLGKFENTSHIPFIFLTAKSERADVRKAMEMGADDYIIKPFDDLELLNAIESRFRKRDGLNAAVHHLQSTHVLGQEKQNAALDELISSSRVKKIKKKQLLFEAGDAPIYVYYIIKGKIRTFLTYSDGRMLSTGIYTENEFFGFEPILMDENYADSAISMEAVEVALLPRADFFELIYRMPVIAHKFGKMLSFQVRELGEQMLGFAYDSVRKRVANALLQAVHSSSVDNHGQEITIQLSREDLATLAGTANETISRMLADFKEEKIITKKGGTIVIHSLERLKNIR